jgi:uncharacterized protein YbjT (DUF2867 family)
MKNGIFITGGSGNTGRAFLELLRRNGEFEYLSVTCLCRPGGRHERLRDFPVKVVEGDATDVDSVARAYGGERTVVHISSIFHSRAVLQACRSIDRLIAISSAGVYSKYRSLASRIAACEREIERSGVPYTILRPTMIYGTPHDRNISRLISYIRRSRIIPLPAMGRSIFQPVHVEDLASCMLSVLKRKAGIGKGYDIAGGSSLSLKEIVSIISGLLGKRIVTIPVPLRLAYGSVRAAELLLRRPPRTSQQVLRLLEDKSVDISAAVNELGYRPMTFEEGVRRQIRIMGLAGGRDH